MKNILFYILLLAAVMSYGQGLLPEEKVKKEPPAQPVHQAKKYDWIGGYYEGLERVSLNGKLGFIDKTGKEVIPIKYNDAYSFSKGLALVELNGKLFYINKRGECVIDCNNAPSDHPRAK